MTLYAVFDPQGNRCSDACENELAARASLKHPSLRAMSRSELKTQGYRLAPVGVYNPETQVVVAIGHIQCLQNELKTIRENVDSGLSWCDKFLEASKEKT